MFLGAFGYQDDRFPDRYQHPNVNKLLGFFLPFLSFCKSLGASRNLLTGSYEAGAELPTGDPKFPKTSRTASVLNFSC